MGEPARTTMPTTTDSVQEYYGKILQKSEDLKTNACCTSGAPSPHIAAALRNIHEEVIMKYYGCGECLPDELDGCTVLDLGCGAGRDVYLAAQLVGASGKVIGVDMTTEQLDVAREHEDWHRDKFGYDVKNTEFKQGFIEKLDELGIPDNSVDVIMSNCVINLSPDKDAVLKEAFRILKPGGELYFSDVYSSCRVPQSLRDDEVLWGECLSGALYWNDFISLSKLSGFSDPRLVNDSRITIDNQALQQKCGHIDFYSATYRLFKLVGLDDLCEDYGQAVIYKGTIARNPHSWSLDGHHQIKTGKVFPVCGNTSRMLSDTRFAPHFEFIGNTDTHFGIFDGCGTSIPFVSASVGLLGDGSPCC